IRAKLGEGRAADVLAAGKTLSLDQVVAEARALAAEVATETPGAAPIPRRPFGLSPRELEVLGLIAARPANPEIAAAPGISARTATTHAAHILNKLGLSSRAELIAFAHNEGLA